MKHVHKTNASQRRFYQWHWAKLLSIGLLCVVGISPAAYAQEDDACGPGDEEWRVECMTGKWQLTKADIKGTTVIMPNRNHIPSEWSGSRNAENNSVSLGKMEYGDSSTETYYVPAGETSAKVEVTEMTVTLEWVGTGTPTTSCTLKVNGTAGSGVGSIRDTIARSWNLAPQAGGGISSLSESFAANEGVTSRYLLDPGEYFLEQVDCSGPDKIRYNHYRVKHKLNIKPSSEAKINLLTPLQSLGVGSGIPGISVSAGVAAQLDNRSVRLTRNVGAKEHTEYEDGVAVTYGDTLFSYKEKYIRPGGDQTPPTQMERDVMNKQTFNAIYGGDWQNPIHSWNPEGDEDTFTEHKQDMPLGSLIKQVNGSWKGPASGTQDKHVTYELKDPDTSARAKYVVTMHDPVEWDSNSERDPDTFWDSVEPTNVTRATAGPTGSVEADFLFDSYYFDATKEAVKAGTTALSALIGSASPGVSIPLNLLLQGVGLSIDTYDQSPALNQDGIFGDCWNYENEDPSAECTWEGGKPVTPDDPLEASQLKDKYQLTQPKLALEFEILHFKGTEYATDGKVGPTEHYSRHATGSKHVIGTFKKVNQSVPIPPPVPNTTQRSSSGLSRGES